MTSHAQALQQAIRQRAVIVTGKGGVGKTTVAGFLARSLEARGSRVLALEVDPRESLHRLFGVPPSAGAVMQVSDGLRLCHLRFASALEAVVRAKISNSWLRQRILRSSAWQHVVAGAPGFKELAVLWWIFQQLDSESTEWRPDVVVLDAPAGGHAAAWLRAPALVADAVHSGPVSDEAERLAGRLRSVDETGILLVSTAEEMPVTESLEFQQTVREGVRPEGVSLVAANRLYPRPSSEDRRAALSDEVLDVWLGGAESQDRELSRLRSEIGCEVIELPMRPCPAGPELLAALDASDPESEGEPEDVE